MRTRLGQRAGALLAAVLLQVLLLAAIVFGFGPSERPPPAEEFVTTLVWLPITAIPVVDSPPSRPVPGHATHQAAATAEAGASPLGAGDEGQLSSAASVNWWAEADRVVAGIAEASGRGVVARGHDPMTGSPQLDGPVHKSGESYVDQYGDRIVWLSERCYIISEPPPLGTSAILANVQSSRTTCLGASPARGDLFKDTAEYRKRHPPAPP